MPVPLTAPGVYIEEVPSGVHTITGVATSIAAFVGYTRSGRDNKAKRIFGFPDFQRAFGGLAKNSELSYAVQQFFQNGGSEAYVVRVPGKGAKFASLMLLDAVEDGEPSLLVTATTSGEWGNGLIVDIDYNGLDPENDKVFNLTITDTESGASETFHNVSIDKTQSNFVDAVVNDPDNGSRFVEVTTQADAKRPAANGTLSGEIELDADGKPKNIPDDKNFALKVSTDLPSPGAIDEAPVTLITLEDAKSPPASVAALCRLIERKLTAALSTLPGATVTCKPEVSDDKTFLRIIANVPGAHDALITFDAPESDPDTADAADVLGLADAKANVSHYWLGTKRSADAAAQSDHVKGEEGSQLPGTAELIGEEAKFTGIYALDKVDLFNILCIPDATRAQAGNPAVLDPGTDAGTPLLDPNAIFEAAINYCAKRRAMLLLDPPPSVRDVDTAIAWKTSQLKVRNKNGAAYFPRLRLPDPLNDYQLRTFAPCGVVAGLYARTDAARGVWKAPAGVEATLSGVQGTVYQLTDAEQGALNPLGLNCFRIFPVYGAVAWGARTLVGADVEASEWKYVPVRRLALFLEESLYRGMKWAVFEPNDEPLWSQIRLNVGAFMQTLFRQGAFQGKTPREAYFVKCDSETTTQDDINRGVVNVLVGFAPLKPAEFVVIQIQQMAGQIQV